MNYGNFDLEHAERMYVEYKLNLADNIRMHEANGTDRHKDPQWRSLSVGEHAWWSVLMRSTNV